MKAADIPDEAVLSIIRRSPHVLGWTFTWDIVAALAAPEKVVMAKLRRLRRRGLIDGCPCGCRGDWVLKHPR